MGVEEAATRYCIERFKATKMIEAAPHLLPDDFANQIERVLQQIEILLDVASLPTLDSRIPETALNKIDENAATGLYAEIPPPIAVWEMQRSREIAIICTCLLMAQIGLFAVLAQLRPYPGLEKYEGVERRYVEQFALRIPTIQNLERYGDASNLFNWIDEETERNVWRAHFMVIIRALGLIASIRAGGVTEPRG
jgi:hypothetical protein